MAGFGPKFYPETELVRKVKEARTNGRALLLDDVIDWRVDQNQPEMLTNRTIMQGIPSARGYDPVNARWIGRWMNRLAGLAPETNPRGQMYVPRIELPAWLTLMGVEVILSYHDLSDVTGVEFAGRVDFPEGALGIWRNRNYRGLAFAATAVGRAEDEESTQESSARAAREFPGEPLRAIVVEGAETAPGAEGEMEAEDFAVEPLREGPNRFIYRCRFARPALLYFAQSAYRGWRARVGGTERPLWRACGAFLAVSVPEGESEVEFWYRPPEGFGAAVATSCAAGVALLLALCFGGGRRRAGINPGPED
jgi:hypothetical protein